ncbi:MAG TPA: 2,3-bisphosphoglycerate-independent phosphoglycerate mutase, partial [Patescibacteria group bacterium]|nr:2,3-bisphosphoglycerate-independent phosphoglycerate mutase [Patescibacteria group bacterium]
IPKPIVVAILDGWGEWEVERGNPLKKAKLPTIAKLDAHYPKLHLQASGRSVGLPSEFPGNSEVGHQTLGSGQIIFQHLPLITQEIMNGTFYENETLVNAMDRSKKNNSRLHLVGLLSDGGVHSHIEHLIALLSLAKKRELSEVYIHAFTDGRDTPPQSAEKYIKTLQREMEQIGMGELATIGGRYYGMDRNENWDRVEKAVMAMVDGEGRKEQNPLKAVRQQYAEDITDEYLEPVVLSDDDWRPLGRIGDDDTIICFNFRKDRSKQLAKAFTVDGFDKFEKVEAPKNIRFVGFKKYEKELAMEVAFPSRKITTRLGQILADHNKKQYRIAETEKYAHVTYFFNGGKESPFSGEDRKIIPSKNARSYAEVPEMSAEEVTDNLVEAIDSGKYDFILVNYANPDMVGHTGNIEAGIKAVETVDKYLRSVIDKTLKEKGELIITADHG